MLKGSRIPEFETLASWFRLFPIRLSSTNSFRSNGSTFFFGRDFPVHFLRIYSAVDNPIVFALLPMIKYSLCETLKAMTIVLCFDMSFLGLAIFYGFGIVLKVICKRSAQFLFTKTQLAS